MTRILGLLALCSVAVAVSACSTGASDPSGSGSADDLTGRTFISTEVNGSPIPGGGPLVVEFPEPGRLAATAGCNRFAGAVDLADSTLRSPDLASTMMACPPPRDGADGWLSSLVAESPQWSLDGDALTLTGDGTTVFLTDKKVVDPDRPISGTEWFVTTVRTSDAVMSSAALDETAPELVVTEDGQVSGSTGCNRFTGTAEVSDGTIVFGPLATTRAACTDPELTEIENHVLAVLSGETTYVIDGAEMTLTASNGVDGLGYRAR
ncbi:META domain-containing protein [Rhodococcus sp. F64268]|uniref:META domain-containing protein n=1 Tax=Rhodococcus sp. F64268 TaxID=2926402 RepID=UPI001FF2C2B4|nr:META domain-containing protein [Rhodococcus sp. F64268]MCK0091007.1 META domain-containing protein [Rhodococcus sp. F64268]